MVKGEEEAEVEEAAEAAEVEEGTEVAMIEMINTEEEVKEKEEEGTCNSPIRHFQLFENVVY